MGYCGCEARWRERQVAAGRSEAEVQAGGLSALTATRWISVSRSVLEGRGIDEEYFRCIDVADAALIEAGIRIRGEEQRSSCVENPSIGWFCDADAPRPVDTLTRFEAVNLNIFLRALDWDAAAGFTRDSGGVVLGELERERAGAMARESRSGRQVAEAASAPGPMGSELAMRRVLEGKFK